MPNLADLAPPSRAEPIWKGAYRSLRMAILNRDLLPRTRLIETDLAQSLGISRTPLREALARLELDGLVAGAKTVGYVVSDLREDLPDAYDLRAAIEGYAARLAAERMTKDERLLLQKNVEKSRKITLDDRKTRALLNLEFHQYIALASRSPKIIHAFNNIRDLILTDEDMVLHTDEAHQSFIRDHGLILSAIEIQDGDIADRVMRKHLLSARDLLMEKPRIQQTNHAAR